MLVQVFKTCLQKDVQMKKSLLALSVLGAFAGVAHAQSSVTIYGLIDTGVSYNSKVAKVGGGDGSKFGLNSGVINGSRIGFKGVEDLGGGLSAIFQLETGFSNDTGATDSTGELFRRKSVVGLSGGFGTVLAGRQTDFLDDIGALTSVADFGGIVANTGSGAARLQGTRSNNSVRYNTNNLGGFTGSLIYGFGENAGSAANGQAYGIGGKYENAGLALAAGYYQSKGSAAKTGSDTGSQATGLLANQTAVKTFTLAASYQVTEAARVYGNWSRVKAPSAVSGEVEKANVFDLGANYLLSNNIKLIGSVQHTKLDQKDAAKGKLTQVNLGADYLLSKRTDIYTVVSYLKAKDAVNPGIGSGNAGVQDGNQTALNVGIRHRF
jgi:predicted porin